MSDRRTRCPALYYPSPGGENTFVVDHDPDGRFYVVGKGRAVGIYNNANRANEQTDGYSGYVKKSAKRWGGLNGARKMWDDICDEYHRDGCPPQILPAGFLAPTPVDRASPWHPFDSLPSVASPRTPRVSNEVRSSVSPSPMRAPVSNEVRSSVSPSPMRAPPSNLPFDPPPSYHQLSPAVSSRPRPRPAPSTPVPASRAGPSTPVPTSRTAPSTPVPTSRIAPSTPVSTSRSRPRTPVPASSSPSDSAGYSSGTGYSSDDEGSEIDLAQDMWAIEGLPGKLFVTKELAFANASASPVRNPRYASGTDIDALRLFSRGLI
ncbi:hypothetical protein C8R47DRAFT_1230260 [Mycena vitilis]|nr:hypothetical protein C8R47DRAFT_1230260 [Mycena vitilis]